MIVWLIANAHWIIPTIGFAFSEYRGRKSGGEKASLSQILWDFVKFGATEVGESNDPVEPNNDKLD